MFDLVSNLAISLNYLGKVPSYPILRVTDVPLVHINMLPGRWLACWDTGHKHMMDMEGDGLVRPLMMRFTRDLDSVEIG